MKVFKRFQMTNLPQRQLLLRILMGCTALVVSMGGYYCYKAVRQVMLTSLQENAFQEVERGTEALDRWLANLKVHVETLASSEVVQSMDWEEAQPYLKTEVLRFSDIYAIAIADDQGWRKVIGGEPTSNRDRLYFQKALAGETNISDPLISRANNTPTIAVATPIRPELDLNTPPVGVIHSLVNFERVAYVLDSIEYGDNSYAIAFDSQGNTIAQDDIEPSETASIVEPQLSNIADTPFAAIAPNLRDREAGIQRLSIDNRLQYVAYAPLEEADWSIALVIPRGNIEAQLRFLDAIALIVLGLAITLIAVLWQVQTLEQKRLKKTNDTLEKRVNERTQALSDTLEQLRRSQLRLVQNEKMSALGNLVAGVAHEINNPVNFIYGNLTYVREYNDNLLTLIELYQQHTPTPPPEITDYAAEIEIDFLAEDLPKILASMRIGATRIRDIVLSLRNFSRLDHAEVQSVDLHEGINSTLLLLKHRLKASTNRPEIKVIKNYGNLPKVECYAGQLNQVFMNILSNAIEALEEALSNNADFTDPTITITTQRQGENVSIEIADNGPGMPPKVQQQIFDPFFTTKAIGKGTGMGMSISYQVITERHQGQLRCESELGKGTTFWIDIPLRQAVAQVSPKMAK